MTHDDLQPFLEQFFGVGNAVQWSKYVASEPGDQLRSSLEPWISRVQKQRSPYCLPRVNTVTKQTTWYVLCADSREARSTSEALQAFIGPTYASFNGEFATLSSADPVEKACEHYFGPLVFRLAIIDLKDRAKANLLLDRLIEFHDRASSLTISAIKPIGRLLRDLEMAIIAANEESANLIYGEIRSRGRLSAMNLVFLQVRILSAFNRWGEILHLQSVSDLLNVRRPKSVSEQIATAVYREMYLKYEESGDPAAAIETFQREGKQYQSLVRSTEGFRSSDAIKFAVIAALGASSPNLDYAKRLLENSLSVEDQRWCNTILGKIAVERPVEPVGGASKALDLAEIRYQEGYFDEAFSLFIIKTPDYRSICRVVETAVEIDDSKIARKALEYFETAADEIKAKVLQSRVFINNLEILRGIFGQAEEGASQTIDSLAAWFNCVDSDSRKTNLNNVLNYGLDGWLNQAGFNTGQAAELLRKSRTGTAVETIRNAVPAFIRAFLVDREPARENKPIYYALIDLLIYDEPIDFNNLSAIEQLLEAILTTAPSHEPGNNDFILAVDITKYLWESVASPRQLDWVLSMLDLMIDTGSQKYADPAPILAAITKSIHSFKRRVTDNQWTLLELLAGDLGLSDMLQGLRPAPDQDQTIGQKTIYGALKGKSIAIYSITERIARRFGKLAEQTFDGIKIHYFHDKMLTDRMKSLANSADIFIINTWDSKHAATTGIKANRPSLAITLEPLSKAPQALFQCLYEAVRMQSDVKLDTF